MLRPARRTAPLLVAASLAVPLAARSRTSGTCAAGAAECAPPPAGSGYVGRFDGTQRQQSEAAQAAEELRAGEASRGKTAAKWSIFSERIEGLAREMNMLVNSADPYVRDMSDAEGPAMAAIRKKMEDTDWATLWDQRKTMFSYGSEMSTDPVEAMFLKMMTYMKNPKRVLEVGMFVGYGAMAIAEALPADGQVVSLEIDPYLKEWVQDVTKGRVEGKKHEIIVGPALQSLENWKDPGQFDLVFIDANKAEYKRYVEIILERNMLRPGAMIVADNTLYNGYPFMAEAYDTQPHRRDFGNAIREFNDWVRNHPRLEQVILPIRDGVSMIRVRE